MSCSIAHRSDNKLEALLAVVVQSSSEDSRPDRRSMCRQRMPVQLLDTRAYRIDLGVVALFPWSPVTSMALLLMGRYWIRMLPDHFERLSLQTSSQHLIPCNLCRSGVA